MVGALARGDGAAVLVSNGEDRALVELLRRHLKVLVDRGRLSMWHADDIAAGARRDDAIYAAHAAARALVLFVSATFLAEEFAPGAPAHRRALAAASRGVPVLWIPVRHSAHDATEVRDFAPLWDPARPLDGLPEAELHAACVQICERIAAAFAGFALPPLDAAPRAHRRRERVGARGLVLALVPALGLPVVLATMFLTRGAEGHLVYVVASFVLGPLGLTALVLRQKGPFYASLASALYLTRRAPVDGAMGATALPTSAKVALAVGLGAAAVPPGAHVYETMEAAEPRDAEPAAALRAAESEPAREARTSPPRARAGAEVSPPSTEGHDRAALEPLARVESHVPADRTELVAAAAAGAPGGVPEPPARRGSKGDTAPHEGASAASREPPRAKEEPDAIEEVIVAAPSCPMSTTWIAGGAWTNASGETKSVAPLCFDTTEVSVAAYKHCVDARRCSEPASLRSDDNWGKVGAERHPVNDVSRDQAAAYCRHRGARLPTEWEWEWAARGRDAARPYPWGDAAPSCGVAVMSRVQQSGSPADTGCGAGSTAPVGSAPAGASRDGLLGMGGNVSEWTSSSAGGMAVVRGGSWLDADPERLSVRHRRGLGASEAAVDVGFRCVRASAGQ